MHQHTTDTENWLFEISPKKSLFNIPWKEIWRYRDLLFLFVHRNLTTTYKQTILGPLWFFIQPLFTAITFTIIFNNVAGIQTGTIPPMLFNLAGITVWNYFTACFTDTSNTFRSNAGIFGKVYFPRLITPLSVVITNLVKMGIQFLLFLFFYGYFVFQGMEATFDYKLVFFPFLVIGMGLMGLGLGMIVSSMVTKYRDLSYLISFGVQLLMYVSAVMYPLALIKEKLPNYSWLVEYNPLAYMIETTRFVLLNQGTFTLNGMLYTLFVMAVLLFLGLLLFHRTEKSFIDTV
jgi:lipopolysaccharide transport system permease protein